MSHLLGGDFKLLDGTAAFLEEEAPPSFLELEIPTEEMDDYNRFHCSVLSNHNLRNFCNISLWYFCINKSVHCLTGVKHPKRRTGTSER